MSAPTALPSAEVVRHEVRTTFRSMASDISVRLGPGSARPDRLLAEVHAVFDAVARECTRFEATSDLMRANAAGAGWCPVGEWCFAALDEAYQAYRASAGRFDPRVLRRLDELGYRGAPLPPTGDCGGPWRPRFDPGRSAVAVGPCPVDLGGIGKGLAVRWAAERIADESPSFLIDAGGDCFVRGAAADGGPWRIGVEDPLGGPRPVAVVAVTDVACTTSSTRRLRWEHGGRAVHHLIDPATGEPGGAGLAAVTAIGSDPACAEVWSKVLFLSGAAGIARAADRDDLAVLWVGTDGSVGMNAAMRPLVIWQDGA